MRQARDTKTRAGARRGRRSQWGLLLLALALCAVAAATAGAQSGRRKTSPISPVPTPTPAAEPEGESESEGRPRRQAGGSGQLSFVVYRLDNAFPHVDFNVENMLMNAFMDRLTRSKDLTANYGGKRISRKEAQEIAKTEGESHVVLVELEDDIGAGGRPGGGAGQTDTRSLDVKTYVYEMGTGTLKFVDQTSQRPYRQTTAGRTIGGIPLPLPAPRARIERFPGELQLEQAARDAADRLMQRFHLRLPPDN
jgi:hypothetical protein